MMPDDPVETRLYISTGPGTPVALVDRTQYRLTLQTCTYGIQGLPYLEFTEEVAAAPLPVGDPYYQTQTLQGNFRSGQWIVVELYNLTTLATNVVFLGQIVSNHVSNITTGCINVGYKALGLRRWAGEIYTSNTDYSGRVQYNLSPLDVQFIWDLSAFTLGDCIYAYLQLHRAALEFYSIQIPADPATDSTSVLAQGAFTQVPLEPIVLQGRILDAIDGLLSQLAPKVAMYLDSSDWTVDTPKTYLQFIDTTLLTPTTLTLNQDPVKVAGLNGDTTNAFTCTILRGAGDIDGALLIWNPDLSAFGLKPGWTGPQESGWTWADYITPISAGTITGIPNTEQLTIHPTSGLTYWAKNLDGTWTIVFDGVESIVSSTGGDNYLAQYAFWFQFGFSTTLPPPYPGSVSGTASAVFGTMYEIVDSTECTSGSATITVSPPLSQGWSGGLTYQIRPGPLQANPVWRKFIIPLEADGGVPNQPYGGIAGHLTKHFAPGRGYGWSPVAGTIQITTVPVSEITGTTPANPPLPASSTSGPASFQIVPSQDGVIPGYILFDTPVVAFSNQISDLLLGHIPVPITQVKAVIPYSKGALEVYYPPPTGNPRTTGHFNFSGTAYTKHGIERYYYRDYYSWVSQAQSSTMGKLAQQIAETMQDEVIDSTVNYYGFRWELMGLGQSLNIASVLTTTGFEVGVLPNGIPVRTITITWPENEGSLQVVSFHINNARAPFRGERNYLHPLWRRENPTLDTMTRASSLTMGRDSPLQVGLIHGMKNIKAQTDDPTGAMGQVRGVQEGFREATQDSLGMARENIQGSLGQAREGIQDSLGMARGQVNQNLLAGRDPAAIIAQQQFQAQSIYAGLGYGGGVNKYHGKQTQADKMQAEQHRKRTEADEARHEKRWSEWAGEATSKSGKQVREEARKQASRDRQAAHDEARQLERPAEEMAKANKARDYNDRIAKQKRDEELAREGKLPADGSQE